LETQRGAGYGWSRPFPWERGLSGEIPTPPESKNPPSRAYRKLDEILAVIGENPSPRSLVADLGSAPGGWTYRLANDLVCIIFPFLGRKWESVSHTAKLNFFCFFFFFFFRCGQNIEFFFKVGFLEIDFTTQLEK
jgi:23S rRNA C2498 (ribose-2'-O)-methylase RlmM